MSLYYDYHYVLENQLMTNIFIDSIHSKCIQLLPSVHIAQALCSCWNSAIIITCENSRMVFIAVDIISVFMDKLEMKICQAFPIIRLEHFNLLNLKNSKYCFNIGKTINISETTYYWCIVERFYDKLPFLTTNEIKIKVLEKPTCGYRF